MPDFNTSNKWVPRSPFERLAGCIFLGRLIDKARRYQQSVAAHEDLMQGYMYGETDFMDSRVLRFLKARTSDVDALIASEPDDAKIAHALVDRSSRSPQQTASFNRRMLLMYAAIFAMFDADEGRKTGPIFSALHVFYTAVIYPPFAWKFLRDERKSNRALPRP